MNYNSSSSIALTNSSPLVVNQLSSPPPPRQPTRYETQKRHDWMTFGQYLRNYPSPPVSISGRKYTHMLDFFRFLDQFRKSKVHLQGCTFYGQPDPLAPCPCPLRQAWGSLNALIGRLRAAYEEHRRTPDSNPIANPMIRSYLCEVKDFQAKARGVPYKKKKRKKARKRIDDEGKTTKHPRE